MDDFDSTVSAAAAAGIETEFNGRWGAWISDTGQWWAARRQALSASDLAAGCVPYLQADSPDELRDRIKDEEALAVRPKTRHERQRDKVHPSQDRTPENGDHLWKSRGNGHSRRHSHGSRRQAIEPHARRNDQALRETS